MAKEQLNPIDQLFDPENNDPITLLDNNNNPAKFDQIALIPLDETQSVYAILKPLFEVEGMSEDEALVFEIVDDEENDESYIEIVNDEKIINKVFESEVGVGFDAYKEEYVNMVEAGILDPAKVTRSALQNATSVASTLLTTESVVANIKEDMPAMPAGGGMGMM